MVVVEDVFLVEVDGMDSLEFSMEDIEYIEGNMDPLIEEASLNIGIKDIEGNMNHPTDEAGADMDVKEEWQVGKDNTMNIEENMDHPIRQVGVDMDEKNEQNKTLDMVEKVGEDKKLVDMG